MIPDSPRRTAADSSLPRADVVEVRPVIEAGHRFGERRDRTPRLRSTKASEQRFTPG